MKGLSILIMLCLTGCFSLNVKEYDNSYVYYKLLQTDSVNQVKQYLSDLSRSDRNDIIKETHNPYGLGVIAISIYMDKPELIQTLHDLGADINQPGTNGLTALHIAASTGDVKTLRSLIDDYGAVPALDKAQETLLHVAVKVINNPTIGEILSRYPDMLDAQDNLGNTALFYAVRNKDTDTIKFLKKKGAKSNIKNNEGVSPLSYSIDMSYSDIVTLLGGKE